MDKEKPAPNSFLGFLALLFIGLKLTGFIAWSWFWVLSPIWIPLVVVVFIVLLLAALNQ